MVLLIFFPKYDSSSIFEALKYYLFSLSNSTFSSLPVFLFLPLPSHVFLFSVISYEFILHVADIFIFALFSSLYPFSYFLPPSSPPLLHFINVVVPILTYSFFRAKFRSQIHITHLISSSFYAATTVFGIFQKVKLSSS